jgi:hypothetical protein
MVLEVRLLKISDFGIGWPKQNSDDSSIVKKWTSCLLKVIVKSESKLYKYNKY